MKRAIVTLFLVFVITLGVWAEGSTEDRGASRDDVMTIKWLAAVQPNEDDSWGELFMEKKFGINIDIMRVDNENRMQQINLKMASGEYPDYLTLGSMTEVAEYAKKNVLAAIPMRAVDANMPKYKALATGFDPLMFQYSIIDGKIYGIPNVRANGAYYIPIAFRADWLEKVGEDTPRTIDDYTRVFTKFRNNDPDGNGKKDTYGFTMSLEGRKDRFLPSIFGAFGVNPFLWLENQKGELQHGFTMEGTKKALMQLNEWFEAGLIDPEFITDKFRTQQNDDIAYKFASGRVGFMNCLSFDDYQHDNDGHLTAKWVANAPEWQDHFAKYSSEPAKAYQYPAFRSLDELDGVPYPAYINPPLPIGPDGKSGSTRSGALRGFITYGKQVEEDPAKQAKLLEITEVMVFDSEFSLSMFYGPKDEAWKYDSDGKVVFIPEFRDSEFWHPQGVLNGTIWCFNSTFWADGNLLKAGGERMIQRYERCGDVVALGEPSYEDAVKVALSSANDYPELDTVIFEYIVKCIIGDLDVASTFDDTVAEWKANGGKVLTDEANEWYASIK